MLEDISKLNFRESSHKRAPPRVATRAKEIKVYFPLTYSRHDATQNAPIGVWEFKEGLAISSANFSFKFSGSIKAALRVKMSKIYTDFIPILYRFYTDLVTYSRALSCWRINLSCLSWYCGRFSFNSRLKRINCIRYRSPVMVSLGFNSS